MRALWVCALVVLGCSSAGTVDEGPDTAGTGGGSATGGALTSSGGESSGAGGDVASGGTDTGGTGGAAATGGASSGGATGGSEPGGAPSGGTSSGGTSAGGSASGGSNSGGTSTGGTSSGGSSSGGTPSTGGGSSHYTTEAADCINNGVRYVAGDACLFIFEASAGYQLRVNENVASWSCASKANGKTITLSPGQATQVNASSDFIVFEPDNQGECGFVCSEELGVERKCTIAANRVLGGSVNWSGSPRCYAQTVPPGPFTACSW